MQVIKESSNLDSSGFNEIKDNEMNPSSIKRNFVVICLTFALVFTSYNAVINLQSSINDDNNVGLYGLAINSAFSILSCLFLTNPLIFLCGYKWTMLLAQSAFLFFVAANIYPKEWLMYPASAICGTFRAAFGIAQSAYVAALATNNNNGDNSKSKLDKYFALFFSALQSSQIWGNLLSYIVLQTSPNDLVSKNVTLCGATYLSTEQSPLARISEQLPHKTTLILYTTFMSLIVVSLILVVAFLDNRQNSKAPSSAGLVRETFTYMTATLKQTKNSKQIMLLPLPFLVGASEGFMFGIFTNSFVTCSVGVQYVGLVMFAFGLTSCLFSIVIAYVINFKNRLQWCLVGFFLWYILLIIMVLWKPIPSQIHVLFIIASLAGIASAIWGPLLSILHGALFPRNEEAAFSNMVLSQNVGYMVVYYYGGLIRVRTSIILQAFYLTVTVISYVIMEIRGRQDNSEKLETLPFAVPEITKTESE